VSTTQPYYGIDAPWASWVEYKLNTTSSKFEASTANIYGGMRMGGSSYYGLNVKDPTDPKFLFQIDPVNGAIKSSTSAANTTTANAAIQAMGQSWSKPTLANIRFNNQVRKVMIVGGGYDPAYETADYIPQNSLGSTTTTTTTGPVISTKTSTSTETTDPVTLSTKSEGMLYATCLLFGSDSSPSVTTGPVINGPVTSSPITTTSTSGNTVTRTTETTTTTTETTTTTITSTKYS